MTCRVIFATGETLISVLMQAQDSAERSVPNSKQWEAVKRLVEVASRATCEPRRFHENDDGWQQEMGEAIVAVRLQMPRPASDFAHKFKERDQWPS